MPATQIARKSARIVLSVMVATACASGSGLRAPAADGHFAGSSNDVIAEPELSRLAPGHSALDAVEQARPWFLHPRGSVSSASIDGSPPTEPSVLQTIPITDVKEIRLVHGAGPTAIRADGTIVVGDVILVVTRKGRE